MPDVFKEVIAGSAPVFVLIAGPNGSGKSTFRRERLDRINFPCLDPDKLVYEKLGHHPTTPDESLAATKEAAEQVHRCFRERQSIALESVFSDTKGIKLKLLADAASAGFRTILIFIGVDDPQISEARVAQRIEDGGHDVPDELIHERFPKCFANLKAAIPLVDLVLLFDNSGCYGSQDEMGDGLRHYRFAVIRGGKLVELLTPLPRWYTQFGIGDGIGVEPSGT